VQFRTKSGELEMKKLFLLSAAVLLGLALPATAAQIELGDGAAGFVSVLASGGGGAAVSGASANGFDLTLSGSGSPVLSLPDILDGNTIDAILTGGGPSSVNVWATSTGNMSPTGLQSLLSSFTQNDLTTGWTVTANTYADNTDAAFGTQQLLATTLFTTSDPPDVTMIAAALLGAGPYSVTEEWIISANGPGDTNNSTDIGLATPLPAAVWMFGSVLGLAGMVLRRRKQHGGVSVLAA
jgi:hypothetical protein